MNKRVDRRRLVMEVFIFIQITQDLMMDFANREQVKKRFRYETNRIFRLFETMRKKVKRDIPDETVLVTFENAVNGFVDDNEYDIDAVKRSLRQELTGKLMEDQVEPAVLIGMIGGFCDIVRQIKKYLTDRDDMDLADIYRYLKYIDTHIGFKYVNEDAGKPDFAACRESMISMYNKIGADVEAWLRG